MTEAALADALLLANEILDARLKYGLNVPPRVFAAARRLIPLGPGGEKIGNCESCGDPLYEGDDVKRWADEVVTHRCCPDPSAEDRELPVNVSEDLFGHGAEILDAMGLVTKGELDPWPEVKERSVRVVIVQPADGRTWRVALLVRQRGTFVNVYRWMPSLGETAFSFESSYETAR